MNTMLKPIVYVSIAGALTLGATNATAQQAPSRGANGSQLFKTFGPTDVTAESASADWAAEGTMTNGHLELNPHFPPPIPWPLPKSKFPSARCADQILVQVR